MSATEEKLQEPATTTTTAAPVFGATGRKIIYGPDGKPCRSCNTLLDFKMATGKPITKPIINTSDNVKDTSTSTTSTITKEKGNVSENKNNGYAQLDPPDVTELGRSTWTFLHSLAATYPPKPTQLQQNEMVQFLSIFAKVYPCWFCAKDFKNYIEKEETKPRVKTQEEFGRWLCDAHNEVNVKIGKPKFDCNLWRQRWKDGWEESEKKN